MESIGIVRAQKDNKIFVEFTRESACGESCESCNAKCSESEPELFEFNKMGLANKDLMSLIAGILSFIISFIILRSIDKNYGKTSGASILLEKM